MKFLWLIGAVACWTILPTDVDIAGAAQPSAKQQSAAPSRSPAPADQKQTLSVDAVAEQIRRLEDTAAIAPEEKDELLKLYREALDLLRRAADWKSKAAEFELVTKSTPATLKALASEVGATPRISAPLRKNATLSELEQSLTTSENELAVAQESLDEWDAEPQRRSKRRIDVAEQTSVLESRLSEIHKQIAAIEPGNASGPLGAARMTLLLAEQKAIEAEIDALQNELESYDAGNGDLVKLEREKAIRAVRAQEERVAELREIVNRRRRDETELQVLAATEAHEKVAAAAPEIRRLAERNKALAEERAALAARIEQVDRQRDLVDKTLGRVSRDYELITEKIDAAKEMTDAVGQLLRKQRALLPDLKVSRVNMATRQEETANYQLRTYELESRRSELDNFEEQVQEMLNEVGTNNHFQEQEIRRLLTTEAQYVDGLLEATDSYLVKLVDLDLAQRKLITVVEDYARFIDQRVLWIRSTKRVGTNDFVRMWEAVRWLGSSDGWLGVWAGLYGDLRENPELVLTVLVLLVPLLGMQQRLRRVIGELGSQAAKGSSTSFVLTLKALIVSLLVAALWPAVIWFLGWRLSLAVPGAVLAHALGHGLQVTAGVFFPLELFRQVCRGRGLAEAHFGWPGAGLRTLRRQLGWLMACGLPLLLLVATCEAQPSEVIKGSLGRAMFIAGQLVVALFMHRVFRPGQGAIYQALAPLGTSLLVRFGTLWHVVAVGAPVILGLLAWAGYYYTALRLAWRVQSTLWLMIGLLVINAVMVRWLLLARRRLAIQQARQKRAAQLEQKEAVGLGGESAAVVVESELLDLGEVDTQSRRLLRSFVLLGVIGGLGLIWIDVMPALGMLDQMVLWTDSFTGISVTLANLLVAVVVLAMTFIAGRNVPGLIEIAIVHPLGLDRAVAYAVTTVARYFITVVGLIGAFGAIGVGWSKVQWLVAAITVGLGFGLQEIFANFVSGLIVLFERPVRVGDIVTVGEISGTVSRIRMRATTITDPDRKELIVPNKEFITGRLVNWTLSDPVLRVVVPVGIGYGADVDKAIRLLREIAEDTPGLLSDPPPAALFVGFGEKSLNLELRAFVSHIDRHQAVRHQLHERVNWAFQEAGIEMMVSPAAPLRVRQVETPALRVESTTKSAS